MGLNKLWSAIHAQRLAFNMLFCSLLLWPWAPLPRETISGFFGRSAANGARCSKLIAAFIDWMHPREPNHCAVTAQMEYDARVCLMYHL